MRLVYFCLIMTIKPRILFFCLSLFSGLFSSAQFNNVLENDKARPVLTPSEFDVDSVHYKGQVQMLRDKPGNRTHWIWTEFDKYKSKAKKDSSYIVYSRTSGNEKPSDGKRISFFAGDCSNRDGSLRASEPINGANGELYVCWAGPKGLAFQRSLDSGATWLMQEKIIHSIVNGWEQQVDGISLDCSPRLAVDLDGPYKGRIYIIWSDEKNSANNKDVFLVYSDDQGENWTEAILLSYHPNHKEQFQPQISVQPGTGHLFVTFFDRQNYHEQFRATDLYLGISKNGGLKFDFFRLNQTTIQLDSSITSVRGLVFIPKTTDAKIIWTQMTDNNRLHFYSALINDSTIKAYAARELEQELEFPKTLSFGSDIAFDFVLKKESTVSLVLTRPLEPVFSQTILKEVKFPAGKNHLKFSPKKLGIKRDNYILTIYYSGRNRTAWILR